MSKIMKKYSSSHLLDRLEQVSRHMSNLDDDLFPYEDANPCDICQRITLERLSAGYTHLNFAGLVKSSSQGCKICTLLKLACLKTLCNYLDIQDQTQIRIAEEQLLQSVEAEGHVDIPVQLNSFQERASETCLSPKIQVKCHVSKWGLTNLGLYKDGHTRTIPDLAGHRLSRRADNYSNFQQIKAWLRDAFRHGQLHECIGDGKEWHDAVSPLPKRVIDVSTSPDVSIVHLKDSTNLPQGLYLCLSHCWSDSAPMTTTTQTLAQRCNGIRMNDLSPTLRDTVSLARQLDIQYIWVDSLCILQDSQEDWEMESSKMGTYYGSSLLTILAGMDGSKGLFGERESPPIPYCRLSSPSGPGGASVYLYFALFPHVPRRGSNDIPKAYTRGWILQEEILSPRVLSFEPSQTYFRTSLVEKYESGSVVEAFKSKRLLHPEKWSVLVGEYCKLSLTIESDKLPALSGLAHEYQVRWNDQYLAGLWRNELWRQLQWYVFSSEGHLLRRPSTYRAPTWSWASVEGQKFVFFARIESEELSYIEILRASTEPSGRDPLGAVSSGVLVLRGMLLIGHCHREDKDSIPITPTEYAFYYVNAENRKKRLGGITCDVALEDPQGGGDEEVTLLYLSGYFATVLRPVAGFEATYERIGAINVALRFTALIASELSGLLKPMVISLV